MGASCCRVDTASGGKGAPMDWLTRLELAHSWADDPLTHLSRTGKGEVTFAATPSG